MTRQLDHIRTRSVLLTRRGLVCSPAANDRQSDERMQALDAELASLGFALSMTLRERLRTIPDEPLHVVVDWMLDTLMTARGVSETHTPLFWNFPHDVPEDTFAFWLQRFAVHVAQREDAPCLFCGERSTTHILEPCRHVVCEQCFDGSNFTGCPVCGAKVADSPFFEPRAPRTAGHEQHRWDVLNVGADVETEARTLFASLCERTQALSPDDRAALVALLEDWGDAALAWLAERIPLRENVAQIFGTLFNVCDPDLVFEHAKLHLRTATDVLRFIAAFSGADPSLQRQLRYKPVPVASAPSKILQMIANWFGGTIPPAYHTAYVPQQVARFKVAKLSRKLRRALLGLLDQMPRDRLLEDMMRHQSLWVWVGEFLHPGEYKTRFPRAFEGFCLVRADGVADPEFASFYSRVETAAAAGAVDALVATLRERPGELGRRLDHALRLGAMHGATDLVIATFDEVVSELATPLLVGLGAHMRVRTERAPVRIFWPKGGTVTGVSRGDDRELLGDATVTRVGAIVERELLRRFAEVEGHDTFVIDRALHDIIVPFNERTASSSAVSLTRGSRVAVPDSKIVRLFLHWCEPQNGHRTDLDLSVGFYDADWGYVGVCSYYALAFENIAKSSGDFTSAPFPDGASEFVDLDRAAARARGIRYAVMVVNAFSGMAFGQLERAYAGLMLRDDDEGLHFDPRTVELKFQLAGGHGVFMPVVFDLETDELHWVDSYSPGQLAFNNVETSTRAIQRICPESIDYFAFGSRPTMWELALLHAAARGRIVFVRDGDDVRRYVRSPTESAANFHTRLREAQGGEPGTTWAPDAPVTALLHRGDVTLAPGSDVYALFREQLSPNLAAADLLAISAP